MLDALRKGASGWLAQIFIALLVLSFAVWGVADIFTGFRGDTVATVGKTDVTAQQFYRQYEQAKRQLGQQIGRAVTDEQARLFGVPSQVLGRLVTEAALDDQASNLGLGVSGETLAKQIADDPSFQSPTGSFDRGRFVQVINANGMTEDQFINQLRRSYVRQQLASALVGTSKVPDAYMRAFHEYQSEERDISYLTLSPALAGDIGEPTDTELAAFFEERKSEWRAPELRAARVMTMTPEDMANTGEVSDDEARKVYDAQLASRFTTPERRQVEQIVFKDTAEATEAASALADGKTYDELIVDRGLKPEDVDIGMVTRDKLLDPAVAEAAFEMAPDSISGIVDGRFGPVILRVTTVEPEVVVPFDTAKAEIKQELAEARAGQEIADQLDVIEDARAGGSTLEDVAANYDLNLVTYPAIDRAGNDGDGKPITDLPNPNELVTAIFDSDVGLENNPLPLDSGFMWFEVTAVNAERDRELSEVREKVITAYRQAELDKRLTELAEDIRDRVKQGEAIDAIALEKSVDVKTATGVKRLAPATDDLTTAAIQAAFGGPRGHAAVADGADQSKIVVVAAEVTVPPYFSGAPDLADTEERLSQDVANDLLTEYVGQLQDQVGVSVNQVALQQLIGLGDPGT